MDYRPGARPLECLTSLPVSLHRRNESRAFSSVGSRELHERKPRMMQSVSPFGPHAGTSEECITDDLLYSNDNIAIVDSLNTADLE
jgi:hypothetical protein